MCLDRSTLGEAKRRPLLGAELENNFLNGHFPARVVTQIMEGRQMFGRNLRRARITAGLTPSDIQDRAGVPEQLLDEVERGQIDPSLGIMTTLANAVEQELFMLLEPSG
jgi:DNA-binding XRE family transcriptional regulator